MSTRTSLPLPLFFALTSLLLIVFLPLAANAQYNSDSPSCAKICYAKGLERVTNGDWEGLTVGDTTGRCAHRGFNRALEKCWETFCDSSFEIDVGRSQWGDACAFASSTEALAAAVQTSLAAKVATDADYAILEKRTVPTAAPALARKRTRRAVKFGEPCNRA